MSVLTLAACAARAFFELSRLHSQSEQQDEGEHSHAENDGGDPGNFDVESPSWVKCHAPSLAAVGRQQH